MPVDNSQTRVQENKNRYLFGVQLEVTSMLLEAERRRLSVLQKDLCFSLNSQAGSLKAKEKQQHELILAISRIQQQYDQLEQEYHQAALGVLKKTNSQKGKAGRSQPAIGLKQFPKFRPTIFGTLASLSSAKDLKGMPQLHNKCGDTSNGTTNGVSSLHSSHNGTTNGCLNKHQHCDSVINQTSHNINLVFENGNLVSGPLESLIQHLVPTSTYYPDRTYLFAFLLSSRLFIKPHELLAEICRLSAIQLQQQHTAATILPPDKTESFVNLCPNLVHLFSDWTETFPYDFRDDRLMKQLKIVCHRCVQIDPRLRKEVNQLIQNVLHKLQNLEKYEEFLAKINTEAVNRLISTISVTNIMEVCNSPAVLAQQLTRIELERLSSIGPEEFVEAFAKENPNIEVSFRDIKKTKNLESYIQWFNRLSYFVATEVCLQLKKKHRAKVIEYFIDTGKECFNIGNFNSLMAIIAGLNMSPVLRLKKTWNKVNTAKFEILEHQMDPSSNFASYRSTLKAAMWRSQGALVEKEKIVIPFFSLLVKDLYFLNEGCASKQPNGFINFDKFWQLAKQVTEFLAWKEVVCPFEKNPKVINYLLINPVFSEHAVSLASFDCEPPENSFEKERFRTLKFQMQA